MLVTMKAIILDKNEILVYIYYQYSFRVVVNKGVESLDRKVEEVLALRCFCFCHYLL